MENLEKLRDYLRTGTAGKRRSGALKIVFQLELLSARGSPQRFQGGRPSIHFSRPPSTVPPRRKDFCCCCAGWRPSPAASHFQLRFCKSYKSQIQRSCDLRIPLNAARPSVPQANPPMTRMVRLVASLSCARQEISKTDRRRAMPDHGGPPRRIAITKDPEIPPCSHSVSPRLCGELSWPALWIYPCVACNPGIPR